MDTLLEAKLLIERWRKQYNTVRSHSGGPETTTPVNRHEVRMKRSPTRHRTPPHSARRPTQSTAGGRPILPHAGWRLRGTGAGALLLLSVVAARLVAEQPNVFEKPIRVEYGDPDTIAPMMAPVMTVDWDRDGRQDLVGRNYWWPEPPKWWRNTGRVRDGVTLFERAGDGGIDEQRYGDPTCTMVGNLDSNSYHDAIVATPDGYEWHEDTTASGVRRFQKRGVLQSAVAGKLGFPEKGEEHPACWLADFDGDGRCDLLVGTRSVGMERYFPAGGIGFGRGWKDGTWLPRDLTASVWLHRNVGDQQNPVFSNGHLLLAGPGRRAITFFDHAEPVVVDFDGDGRRDLLVGTLDRVVVFLNRGQARGAPRLDGGHALTFAGRAELPYANRTLFAFRDQQGLVRLRLGGPLASEAVQLDRDKPFEFGPLRTIPFRGAELRLDDFAVPSAADWDGDGKIDLIVGGQDGWIWFFKNLDPAGGVGRWAAPQWLQADGKTIRFADRECLQGPVERMWGYSNPTVADWDLDGDLDLICGSMSDTYAWFENIGGRTEPRLTHRGPLRFGPGEGEPVSSGWRSRPGVGDLDGDGLPDLIGVDGQSRLCWWRRGRGDDGLRLGAPELPVDAAGQPLVVAGHGRHIGRTKIAVCDWDHDGRADVLCSPPITQNGGYQFFFGNRGVRDGRVVMKPEPRRIILKNVDTPPFTHYAMCEPVDFNGDGQWEVLAGFDRGTIYYWRD